MDIKNINKSYIVFVLYLILSSWIFQGKAYSTIRLATFKKSLPSLTTTIQIRHYNLSSMHILKSNQFHQFNEKCQEKFVNPLCQQWRMSVEDFKKNPIQYLTIPIVAALVGWFTNWVGVNMLFYPIKWTGIPIKQYSEQPLGLIGWQGVVPAKRFQMARRMVDVTINQLLSIKEVFGRLESTVLAKILSSSIQKILYNGLIPLPILQRYLSKVSQDVIQNIEQLVDIRSIVVDGMTKDPRTLGSFFQRVGKNELAFLVESGTYFGFILGLMQMVQWMVFPKNWTLPVSGAIVGYITNYIALKMIFEPLHPTKVGPFLLQGLFLKRQLEVSREFSGYITKNILNSRELWSQILLSPTKLNLFKEIIKRNVRFLSQNDINRIISTLQKELLTNAQHPLHLYCDHKLNLKWTLIHRMARLSPAQFEQVLHPIFQEDELTLIVAGGVLGLIAGYLQWKLNDYLVLQREKKKNKQDVEHKHYDGDLNETNGHPQERYSLIHGVIRRTKADLPIVFNKFMSELQVKQLLVYTKCVQVYNRLKVTPRPWNTPSEKSVQPDKVGKWSSFNIDSQLHVGSDSIEANIEIPPDSTLPTPIVVTTPSS